MVFFMIANPSKNGSNPSKGGFRMDEPLRQEVEFMETLGSSESVDGERII